LSACGCTEPAPDRHCRGGHASTFQVPLCGAGQVFGGSPKTARGSCALPNPCVGRGQPFPVDTCWKRWHRRYLVVAIGGRHGGRPSSWLSLKGK
jgi:hypothetical protein